MIRNDDDDDDDDDNDDVDDIDDDDDDDDNRAKTIPLTPVAVVHAAFVSSGCMTPVKNSARRNNRIWI